MCPRESHDARPPAVFVMGPTASGKTDLAVALAERFPVGIISVDSAMVYRGMDIGTAKPGPDVLLRAPHRLIDICDPSEVYSAARFRYDALREMQSIVSAGRIPLLVGGTMLYFAALQRGLSELPSADPAVRRSLEAEAVQYGWAHLHRRLAAVDPAAARRIHPNDPQRIQRALEVHQLTGKPISSLQDETRQLPPFPYRVLKLALGSGDRDVLHDRIAARFRGMLEAGFEEEVRRLLERSDLDPSLPSMRAVGYRQMRAFILGECDRETMLQQGTVATRQLAKRQLTWLRADPEVRWLDGDAGKTLEQAWKIVQDFLVDEDLDASCRV